MGIVDAVDNGIKGHTVIFPGAGVDESVVPRAPGSLELVTDIDHEIVRDHCVLAVVPGDVIAGEGIDILPAKRFPDDPLDILDPVFDFFFPKAEIIGFRVRIFIFFP